MNPLISKAIAERLPLSFSYKGAPRWVEPHTYGQQANGSDGLCAWQVAGGSGEGFRLFLTQDMTNVRLGESTFAEPRSGYHRGDSRFMLIYAEL